MHIIFADDNAMCAESLNNLKELVLIAEDFYKVIFIEANINKWILAVLSDLILEKAKDNLICINNKEMIKIAGPKKAVHLLEGWLELGGEILRCIEKISEKVKNLQRRLERHLALIIGIRYIMNYTVKPIISYATIRLKLKESYFTILFRSYSIQIKRLLKLPKSMPTSIFAAVKNWEIKYLYNYIIENNIRQVEYLMNKRTEAAKV